MWKSGAVVASILFFLPICAIIMFTSEDKVKTLIKFGILYGKVDPVLGRQL